MLATVDLEAIVMRAIVEISGSMGASVEGCRHLISATHHLTRALARLLDDRLGSLGERQALCGNADPSDDPPFVFAPRSTVSCIGCHGRGVRSRSATALA